MATINPDDLDLDALNALLRAIRNTSERIEEISDDMTEEQRAALRERIRQENDRKLEEFGRSVQRSSKQLINWGNGLTANAGSFSPLTGTVNALTSSLSNLIGKFGLKGKAIGGLLGILGDSVGLIIQQFEKAYANFEKITDVGVIQNFEDLRKSGDRLGLTYNDLATLFENSSKDLAAFGGSSIRGRKMFELMVAESENTRNEFQKLGISALDFNAYQMSYVAQQQRSSRGQMKDLRELSEGSERYIKNLDVMSKLTGLSRKQIQKELEDRQRNARYRAGIDTLDTKVKGNIDNFITVMGSMAPRLAEGLQDAIAGGGVSSSEAFKEMVTSLGQGFDVQGLVDDLRSGNLNFVDAVQRMTKSAKDMDPQLKELTSVVGDANGPMKAYIELVELASRGQRISREEMEKIIAKQKTDLAADKGLTADLSKAKREMYNAGRDIEKLATSSTIAAGAIRGMASAVSGLIKLIVEKTKIKDPYLIQLGRKRQAEIDLQEAQDESGADEARVAGMPGMKPGESLEDYRKRLAEEYIKANDAYVESRRKVDKIENLIKVEEAKKDKNEYLIAKLKDEIAELRKQSADRLGEVNKLRNAKTLLRQREQAEKQAADSRLKLEGAKKGWDQAVAETEEERQKAINELGNDLGLPRPRPRPPGAQPAGAQPAGGGSNSPPSPNSGNDTGPGPTTQTGDSKVNIDDVLRFTAHSGDRLSFDKLDAKLRDKVIAAADEYYKNTKNPVTIESAFRTHEQQQKLWDEGTEDPKNPKIRWRKGLPVAEPGNSSHELGLAVDIRGVNSEIVKAFKNHGLIQNVANDAPHFQMARQAANGALISPKPGGTLVNVAESNKTEAIIPLPDGRSIPVIIKNTGEQIGAMRDMFSGMNERLDTVINLLSSGNRHTRNIAQNFV